MSNTAKIDQNDVKTWLAYNETTGLVESVYVDPATDALMIYVSTSGTPTVTALNNAKIDQNDVKTLLSYNETTGLVEALRCDSSANLLVITV